MPVLLIPAAVVGYKIWQNRRERRRAQESEKEGSEHEGEEGGEELHKIPSEQAPDEVDRNPKLEYMTCSSVSEEDGLANGTGSKEQSKAEQLEPELNKEVLEAEENMDQIAADDNYDHAREEKTRAANMTERRDSKETEPSVEMVLSSTEDCVGDCSIDEGSQVDSETFVSIVTDAGTAGTTNADEQLDDEDCDVVIPVPPLPLEVKSAPQPNGLLMRAESFLAKRGFWTKQRADKSLDHQAMETTHLPKITFK